MFLPHLFLGDGSHILTALYVQVPYSQPADVQPCLDSSRYFVVRVARGQQNVIVGIGFEERADAFKFKSALQEWEHRRDAQTKAQTFFDEMPAQGDLQLQEGQTIRIDLAGKVKSKAGGEASVAGGGGIGVPSGAVGLGMPAPPPVKAAAPKKKVGDKACFNAETTLLLECYLVILPPIASLQPVGLVPRSMVDAVNGWGCRSISRSLIAAVCPLTSALLSAQPEPIPKCMWDSIHQSRVRTSIYMGCIFWLFWGMIIRGLFLQVAS